MAPRSRAQLLAKLDAKQVPAEVSQAVLDRMEEVKLVDDDAFARGWVRSRRSSRGLSRRALSQELRGKGIDDEVAQAALATVGEDEERQTARDLVARRLRATAGLDRVTRTRRLAGMLARKGYSGSLAMTVVRDALTAEEARPGDDLAGEQAGADHPPEVSGD